MAKLPNDDLFEGTKMSFGQHLEELRVALFKAMIGVVAGFLLGLLVAHYVVEFIQTPLKRSLTKYYVTKATERLKKEYENNEVPVDITRLIETEGVVPENLIAEPAQIVDALRAADPEFKIDFKPYRITNDDVLGGDFVALCKAIQKGAAAPGSHAQAVWQLLSEEQRELFERVAKKKTSTNAERTQVIAALNDLIDNPKLRDAKAFKDYNGASSVTTTAWLRTTLDTKFDEDESRRLNKLLVADAFAKEFRPPRIQTVNMRYWKKAEVTLQALGAQEVFMIWMKAAGVTGLIIASPWIFWQIWNFVAAGLYPHEKGYVFIYLPMSLVLFMAGAALAFFFVFDPVLDFLFSFNRSMNIDPDPRISEWLSFVLFLPLGFGIAFQLPLVMLFINRIGIIKVETFLEKWRIAILTIFVLSMLLTPADPISMMLMAVPLTVLYFGGVLLCKWMPRGRNPFAEAS
jgi:sec-independent protein translocase protein TatC